MLTVNFEVIDDTGTQIDTFVKNFRDRADLSDYLVNQPTRLDRYRRILDIVGEEEEQ